MTKVGIIGTGMLGKAVGLHLLESGYELTVYNRTKSKTEELALHGAKVVDSPKEIAQNTDLVIIIVKDSDAVKSVSFEKDGIVGGKHEGLVVADMSTINPLASREIAQKFKENEITMLGIPVMGGPNVAIKGELVLMADGDEPTFEKYRKIFETIANKTFFLGKNGIAHSVKLAMNLQIAMLALSLSEGIMLAKGASIDPAVFLKILNSTYFKTGMSENKAYKMIEDEFKPTFTLKNLKKDLHTINEAARSFGIRLQMGMEAEKIYQQAVEDGFGNLDYTGILSYLRRSIKSEDSNQN